MKNNITGIKKVATLLIVLGPETSAKILKEFPDNLIESIITEIGKISYVGVEDRKKVVEEFGQVLNKRQFVSAGGNKYAEDVLNKAVGQQKAQKLLKNMKSSSGEKKPFEIARKIEADQLIKVLSKEQPQTIAMVLCHLQAEKSAAVLSGLPESIQSEVADRIANMKAVSPIAMKKLEYALEKKLISGSFMESDTIGGVDALVNILNSVTRTTEKNILDGISIKKPELKNEIKAKLFIFEDIKLLDKGSIQKVLREVSTGDMALAIKGASEEVVKLIYENISSRASEAVKEEIEMMGPVKVIKVEEAQQKIVAIIRNLENKGEVIINRGGDDGTIY
ncbi:flagellar motor switch protein FliG [Clostridium sp. DL1XJH146]